jgi:hypothetical protein
MNPLDPYPASPPLPYGTPFDFSAVRHPYGEGLGGKTP